MNVSKTAWLALFPLSLLVGCGSEDPGANPGNDGGGDSCQLPAGALLPWKVGNKWTYKVTEDGMPSQKVTTIGAVEAVGMGPNATKMANKVVTKKGLMDQTISWQGPEGDKIVRYREQSYSASNGALELEEYWEPHKLHVDGSAEHMKKTSAPWIEEYKETKVPTGGAATSHAAMDAWIVISECEAVTVPAGTYKAIKLSKTGGDTKFYWYAPGVGKVKETGGQMEELQSFEAAP
ncbi:MAG: hypothetical protein ABW133_15350 [Polyangiaceae bacterium]